MLPVHVGSLAYVCRRNGLLLTAPGSMQMPKNGPHSERMAYARRVKAAIQRGDSAAVFRGSEKKEAELVRSTVEDAAKKMNNLVMRLDPGNRGGRFSWALVASSASLDNHHTLLMCESSDVKVRLGYNHAGSMC
jgi:hypothetical protein